MESPPSSNTMVGIRWLFMLCCMEVSFKNGEWGGEVRSASNLDIGSSEPGVSCQACGRRRNRQRCVDTSTRKAVRALPIEDGQDGQNGGGHARKAVSKHDHVAPYT